MTLEFLALARTLTQQEANIEIALITSGLALLGILGAALIAKMGSNPKVPREDPDAKPQHDSLLSSYSGEQNAFMHLVIEDSKEVHKRLDKFESIVDQMRQERAQLIGAFTRYISKLVASWGSGGKMPPPDDEDLKILEETLPADWRRRTK